METVMKESDKEKSNMEVEFGKSLDPLKLFYARSITFLFVVLVGLVMTILWSIGNNHAKQAIYEGLGDAHASLFSHVRDRAHVLAQSSSYAYNLARIFASSINRNLSSIYEIESQIAPALFFTLSTMAQASMMAYIGRDGLLFSYYHESNQIYAIFSNGRSKFDASNVSYQFYIQPVDMDTGVRYGNATTYSSSESNGLKWIHNSLDCRNDYVAWGLGFEKFLEALFLFPAPMGKVGVVSIGIKVKDFANSVTSVNLFGGHQYLAMENGHLLAYTGPPSITYTLGNGSFSVLTMDHSNVEQKTTNFSCHGNDHSLFGPTTMESNYLSIEGKTYRFSCAPFDASGIHLVSIMAILCKDNIGIFKKMNIAVISLFFFLVFCFIVWSIIAGMIFNKVKIREMQLCYALIKQKESTQQAERKSMNKSMAFSQASHDVRTSLINITCLIGFCRSLVSPNSDLDENLVQMNVCASKLLDILNSVLDTSRVEAGKMQLEEQEFNMAQMVQESLDSFYIAAQNKGLEMIWDPTDFSIFKYSNVKGDRRRFSQILDNLLGNAIKFTPQGHISFYCWARKSTFKKYHIASKQRFRWASDLFFKNEDPYVSDTSNAIENDPNYIEFTFEVDDSGIGIPKERRASIFENYVQVKESSHGGHEGTGLGLGIVQSFVRLMGGEIGIQDKEHGKKGTCFRFNVFMKSCDTSREEDISSTSNQASNQSYRMALWNYIGFQSVQTRTFPRNPKMENVHILLLIKGDETRKVAKKWLEGFGGKLWGTSYPRFLQFALEKIKHKLLNNSSGSGKFDLLSLSISSSKSISLDGNGELEISTDDQTLPFTKRDLSKRSNINKSTTSLMVLIDLNFEGLFEICSMLNNFSQNMQNIQFKVVWLANSNARKEDLSKVKATRCDLILKKPLYGSHLYPLFSLFQEAEGTTESEPFEFNTLKEIQKVEDGNRLLSLVRSNDVSLQHKGRYPSNSELEIIELKDEHPNTSQLNGMNILLVEDSLVISRYEFLLLSKLGANVEISRNGLEALDKVRSALQETMNAIGTSQKQKLFDVILMDCEMPIMDGYEATRQIRMEENQYGHHILIIALTAHGDREQEQKAILYGMDSYLEKPLREHELLEAIHNFFKFEKHVSCHKYESSCGFRKSCRTN